MNPFGGESLGLLVGKVNFEIKKFGVYSTDLWFSYYTQWSCEYSLESTGESSVNEKWSQEARHWVSLPCFDHISSAFVHLMVGISERLFSLNEGFHD